MVRKLFMITLVSVMTVSFSMVWAGPQMNPGKWEITTQTKMAGMPSQSVTHIQCITAVDMVVLRKN